MKGLKNVSTLWARKPPPVGSTPCDVVYRENKLSLLRYRPRAEGVKYKTPVLLVPSLINRHYVLDLLPGKSFIEYMVSVGHDVYCIEWGIPTDEDRFLTFDDVCDRYLGRALRTVSREAPNDKAHVLGYCLGGTLTSIHAAVRPEHFASLTALAAPIGFDDNGLLSKWARTGEFDLGAITSAFGNAPAWLLQGSFQLLRPTLSLHKAVSLLDKGDREEFLEGFLALETWGSDNIPFPGACFRQYIEELYRKDGLLNESFSMSGHPVKLSSITCPTLAVTFEHDNIVPHKSASVLLERVSSTDKEHIHLIGGHVGSVVSSHAKKTLWPRISKFWADRDAPAGTNVH
ncbi:MAG: alpha/beta fold hydrolase [Polyangiaceae bacterium]|nr:alpha/beta fold hydrolase [Polyangiaceae bacterium]